MSKSDSKLEKAEKVERAAKSAKIKPTKQQIQEEQKHHRAMDKFKLMIAALLIGTGVFAYYYFENLPIFVRALFPIIGVAAGIVIAFFFCTFGRDLLTYIRESTQEVRKVRFPDKTTTLRTTMMVLAFVAVLALFMALADGFISWILFDLLFKRG
ncbi:MAG: preprotein translocase subunit SecE [Neisseriaceae bacterium]|nr:preprotein translocase subunit SecE [Neisseriaceae bacterium]